MPNGAVTPPTSASTRNNWRFQNTASQARTVRGRSAASLCLDSVYAKDTFGPASPPKEKAASLHFPSFREPSPVPSFELDSAWDSRVEEVAQHAGKLGGCGGARDFGTGVGVGGESLAEVGQGSEGRQPQQNTAAIAAHVPSHPNRRPIPRRLSRPLGTRPGREPAKRGAPPRAEAPRWTSETRGFPSFREPSPSPLAPPRLLQAAATRGTVSTQGSGRGIPKSAGPTIARTVTMGFDDGTAGGARPSPSSHHLVARRTRGG